jgi:serine/threonine protein kinase
MAPEVAMEEPYNELCDVYSFSIVFWEMMALAKPYGNIGVVGLIAEVWKDSDGEDGYPVPARRPCPSLVEKGKFWSGRGIKGLLRRCKERRHLRKNTTEKHDAAVGTPASLQALLEACWSFHLEKRPTMHQVVDRLKEEILAIRSKDLDGDRRLSHKRRRSTFVLDADGICALELGDVLDDVGDDADGIESPSTEKKPHPLEVSKSSTDPSSTVRSGDPTMY